MSRLVVASFFAVALGSTACGGPAKGGDAPQAGGAEKAEGLARFAPLEHNTVYTYSTSVEDTGERGVLMMQITRPRPNLAELDVGGRVRRVELTAKGIRHVSGGWLLKPPLRTGAEYPGLSGTVRITSVDKQIRVPAGSYSGCIETTESDSSGTQRVVTVFCPDVGIVLIDAEGSSASGVSRERAELKSFGPKVDIHSL